MNARESMLKLGAAHEVGRAGVWKNVFIKHNCGFGRSCVELPSDVNIRCAIIPKQSCTLVNI